MLKIAEKNLRRETPERADKRTNREANKKGGADALVNINTADVQTLQRLHGIGPALAQRIADYRREHGAFKSLDELAQVKGIGPAKVEKLRAQVEL